jgi:L-lactate dehydrogenase complex protein LldG
MTTQPGSRAQILGRITAATHPPPNDSYESMRRTYVHRGSLSRAACIDLLIQRLREYDAEVVQCIPAEIPARIASTLNANGRHTLVAPSGLDASWLVPNVEWKLDYDLQYDGIEKCDGVVTAAFAAIADSGTIVLHHSNTEGRRVITLLPDWHLCILRISQVVETAPEYFALCSQPPRLATFISGPSATADIEMTRIKGVHGPRFLHVLLVDDETAAA